MLEYGLAQARRISHNMRAAMPSAVPAVMAVSVSISYLIGFHLYRVHCEHLILHNKISLKGEC